MTPKALIFSAAGAFVETDQMLLKAFLKTKAGGERIKTRQHYYLGDDGLFD